MTILTFLSQVFSADQSQQAAVLRVILSHMKAGNKLPSANTSAYSQARSKLCENDLANLSRKIAKEIESTVLPEHYWKGYRITLVDGTILDAADTTANQQAYPQSSRQKAGLGFPAIRVVAVVNYLSGAVLDIAMKGAYGGEMTGEHALLRELMHLFNCNDVLIGDRYYPSYFLMGTLLSCGIAGVFLQHGSRKTNFKKGKRLGHRDHITTWKRPVKPKWMSQEEYEGFPEVIHVREVEVTMKRCGHRDKKKIIVTTFHDSVKVKGEDLAELYGYRWFVEQTFYSLKETMQMGALRGKTPEMLRKEIWIYLIGYNLIRRMMLKAAVQKDRRVNQVSFKLALQAIQVFAQERLIKEGHYLEELLEIITYKKMGNRPNRWEPRAVKKRPKRFPRLQKHRSLYKNAA